MEWGSAFSVQFWCPSHLVPGSWFVVSRVCFKQTLIQQNSSWTFWGKSFWWLAYRQRFFPSTSRWFLPPTTCSNRGLQSCRSINQASKTNELIIMNSRLGIFPFCLGNIIMFSTHLGGSTGCMSIRKSLLYSRLLFTWYWITSSSIEVEGTFSQKSMVFQIV